MTAFDASLEMLASKGFKPYFSIGQVALFHGDCMPLLTALGPGTVNLTITSPPYNIGKEYEEISSTESYIDWCRRWMALIHAATDARGAFWLNLGYFPVSGKGMNVPIPYLLWDKSRFFLMQEVIWNYGAGVAARRYLSPRNEKLLWYVKDPESYTFNLDDIRDPNVKYPNQKKNGKLRCNPNGKNPSDVWLIPKVTSGANRSSPERTPHPAQFPVALIERIAKASSNVGDLILDPFIGSGTTAEVALRSGRACIGFELRADYIKLASQRIQRIHASIAHEARAHTRS